VVLPGADFMVSKLKPAAVVKIGQGGDDGNCFVGDGII